MRLSGKALLKESIARLRKRADEYEAFLNAIPEDLTPEADTGLWEMALDVKSKCL